MVKRYLSLIIIGLFFTISSDCQEIILTPLDGLPLNAELTDAKFFNDNLYVSTNKKLYKYNEAQGWLILPIPDSLKIQNYYDGRHYEFGEVFALNDFGQFVVKAKTENNYYYLTSDDEFITFQIQPDIWEPELTEGFTKLFYTGLDTILMVRGACSDQVTPASFISTDAGLSWTDLLQTYCLPSSSEFIRFENKIYWHHSMTLFPSMSSPHIWRSAKQQFDLDSLKFLQIQVSSTVDMDNPPYHKLRYTFIDSLGNIHYTQAPDPEDFKTYLGSVYNDDIVEMGSGPGGFLKHGIDNTGYFMISNKEVKSEYREPEFDNLYYRNNPEDDFGQALMNIDNVRALHDVIQDEIGGLFFVTYDKVYYTNSITGYQQSILGEIFIDEDSSCSPDVEELNLKNRIVELQYTDGKVINHYTSDGSLDFGIPVGQGDIDVLDVNTDLWENCNEIEFDATTPGAMLETNLGFEATRDCQNLEVYLSTGFFATCFENKMEVRTVNEGTLRSEETELNIQFPIEIVVDSISIPSTPIIGNSYSVVVPELDLFEELAFTIYYQVDCLAEVDKLICTEFSWTLNEPCYANPKNSSICGYVVGSFDPNQITVSNISSQLDTFFTKIDTQFYQIDFQNVGTFAAKNVRIETTIPEELDLKTFRFIGTSHDTEIQFINERKMIIYYNDIILPDSTSNLSESQGFFKFRIEPVDDIEENTQIFSHANIYFDYNQPVRTNDALAWIDFLDRTEDQIKSVLSFRCYPNPSNGEVSISGLNPEENYHYKILSIDGRMVQSGRLLNGQSKLTLSNQRSGLSIIKISNDQGQSETLKLWQIEQD